jgi:hypothetical protein
MGFLSTANTITVTAKLTTSGRRRLLEETNIIFSKFILGDSDANYQTSERLKTGQVLANSGNLGENSTVNDNIASQIRIHSKLYKGAGQTFMKNVEINSNIIGNPEIVELGERIVSGSNLTYVTIDRNDHTSEFSNYFASLNLPIKTGDVNSFSSNTQNTGGFAETGFSGFASNKILIGVIDGNSYGEMIDGKSIKCDLPVYTGYTIGGSPTGVTTYEIYSTFPNTYRPLTQLDSEYEDLSIWSSGIFGPGPNVSYLVCDNVRRPNGDPTKSWSTGYDTFKPFSVNNKSIINISTPTPLNPNGLFEDKVVGFVDIAKGVIAITEPEIVNNIATDFSGDTETGIEVNDLGLYFYTGSTYNTTIDSIINNLVQHIICKAGVGEFYRSESETINNGFDDVRITEIGIVNSSVNDLLAIGKLDRQITKTMGDFVIFDVQIII